MIDFRDTIRRSVPPWLENTWGHRLMYSIAAQLDAVGDSLAASVKSRFPGLYTNETLPLIGRERGIRRGFDETDASYALRLNAWWETHRRKGNPYRLMREVQAYLGTHQIRMRVFNNSGACYTRNADGTTSYFPPPSNWNWDGDPAQWSRFWLILYPDGLWTQSGQWGAGANWGSTTFGNTTWGSNATREQVQTIQAIVDDCKAAHSRCVHIIVAFDNFIFQPGDSAPPLPDGRWGNYSRRNVSGQYVASRDRRALYWAGSLAFQ